MALVKYGAGVEQFSGGDGGGIWYNDRCLEHIISRPRKCNKEPSPKQLKVRRAFRESVTLWNTQIANDPVRRPRLELYATQAHFVNRKGEEVKINGYLMFIKIAITYILIGLAVILKMWISAGCPPL